MTVHQSGTLNCEPGTYYPLKDHQNSVLAFTDTSGTIIETYEYDAWGNPRIYDASGSEITDGKSQIGNRYLFQGREYDSQTHLYYFRARWYNPDTGRWLSKDPIGISGGLNLYAFCGNNPVNFADPTGLAPGDLYKYRDDAARAALEDIYQESVSKDQEMGGFIIKLDDGSYTYTAPVTDPAPHTVHLGPTPDGAVGSYHSHGAKSKGYDDEAYSGDDQQFDLERGLDYGYVVTPSGRIIRSIYWRGLKAFQETEIGKVRKK